MLGLYLKSGGAEPILDPNLRSRTPLAPSTSTQYITVLYLETGTSDRTNIGHDQLLNFLGFTLYPLFILPEQSL